MAGRASKYFDFFSRTERLGHQNGVFGLRITVASASDGLLVWRLGPPVPLAPAAEKTTSPVHGGPVDIFRGGQFTKYPVRYLVGDHSLNILTKYFVDSFVVHCPSVGS